MLDRIIPHDIVVYKVLRGALYTAISYRSVICIIRVKHTDCWTLQLFFLRWLNWSICVYIRCVMDQATNVL